MNKQYITKFLAEKAMGWRKGLEHVGNISVEVWKKGNKFTGYYPNANQVDQFDPLQSIEHAFIVQDAIAKMGDAIRGKYVDELLCVLRMSTQEYGESGELFHLFPLVNATAEQRSIAAFRALATPKQLKEGGL